MASEVIAVTAVANFGGIVCVQLLPMQNGQIVGRLEAADESGLALSETYRVDRYADPSGRSRRPGGTVFMPWVSVAWVADEFEAGDRDDEAGERSAGDGG